VNSTKKFKARKRGIRGFHKTLEQVVKNIADKESYTVILDRNAEGGAIIYAKESLDLTDKVIK
jgi:Skp family chaperone for outer membrane proteins